MPKGGKEKEMGTLFDNGSSTESLDNSEPCLSGEMSIFLVQIGYCTTHRRIPYFCRRSSCCLHLFLLPPLPPLVRLTIGGGCEGNSDFSEWRKGKKTRQQHTIPQTDKKEAKNAACFLLFSISSFANSSGEFYVILRTIKEIAFFGNAIAARVL